jgi:beta-ribofuranosylaminobenzene 5'-phosphate synthase
MFGVHSYHRESPVTVVAPARLHMGFIDLGGSLGRRFGSIGVGVNEIVTRVSIARAEELMAEGPGAERALKTARRFGENLGIRSRVAIRIHEAIPEHIGLGSGTQLALAVGAGLARYHGLDLSVRDIARTIGRGARSGIGIAVFEQGGLILDGGRGPDTVTPPVIARLDIPPQWRFILVFDERGQGLHGKQEIEAFKTLPPFPASETARLCHLLLMKGLPALAERDIVGFGDVITELQNSVGDHFAPAQGGRFTSPEVGESLAWLGARGAVGLGQSSWGPTGFCLVESAARASRLIDSVCGRYAGLSFISASARTCGADILPAAGSTYRSDEPDQAQRPSRSRTHPTR